MGVLAPYLARMRKGRVAVLSLNGGVIMRPNPKKLALALAGALGFTLAGPIANTGAETCLSPYIKALKQPEKVMYLWALPATPGAGEDFLAVIDVNLASPTYGKVLKKIGVSSVGNEAHHVGYTDDRTKLWAASLNTDRFFIFDVASDPMNPKLIKTIDNVAKLTGLSGPHTPYAIPGRMLVSMASGPDGNGPGGLAEFTNDGKYIASHKATNHPYETVVKPEFNRMITSAWFPQSTWMKPLNQWNPQEWSNPNTMLVWDLKERKIIQTLGFGGRGGHAGRSLDAQTGCEVRLQHQQCRQLDLDVQDEGRRHLRVPQGGRRRPRLRSGRPAPVTRRQVPVSQLLRRQRDPGVGHIRSGEHQAA